MNTMPETRRLLAAGGNASESADFVQPALCGTLLPPARDLRDLRGTGDRTMAGAFQGNMLSGGEKFNCHLAGPQYATCKVTCRKFLHCCWLFVAPFL